MTVRELIEALSSFDPDTPVVVTGYEHGVDDVDAARKVVISLRVNDESWSGPHEIVAPASISDEFGKGSDDGHQTCDAVLVGMTTSERRQRT